MEYTIIEVPDLNDSMSRVVLNGKAYLIRFTWNDRGGFWKFGLYDTQSQPIVIGIKIVPRFPVNLLRRDRVAERRVRRDDQAGAHREE